MKTMPQPTNQRLKARAIFAILLVTLGLLYYPSAVQIKCALEVSGDEQAAATSEKKEEVVNKDSSLLLNVPFYVYDELPLIDDVMVGNMTLEETVRNQPMWSSTKHADDYYFIKAALVHPMRTMDPTKAKLFVVPSPSNHLSYTIQYPKIDRAVCWKSICGRKLLAYIDDFLEKSEFFQNSQGKDHIMSFGLWGWDHPKVRGRDFRNIANCNILGFGEANHVQNPDRMYLKTFYVGNACPIAATKKHDFAMVATMKPNDKRFRSRAQICRWMTQDNVYDFSVCGAGTQCPALAESKLGFHVRGDSWGANRLFDTLLSGTVPIFTLPRQYEVNPDWYDWSQLSYFADVRNQTLFLDAVNRIVKDEEDYESKRQAVVSNRDLFDWTTMIPFDVYLYMLQAELFPETRISESPYSALILPPPLSTPETNLRSQLRKR